MHAKTLSTPVLFLIFNRPDTTRRVFEAIRQVRPRRLYIAVDGPRDDKPGEAEKVREVREFVMSSIDWDCEVKTLFRDKNLGCKYAVSGAITWFFENEERGIILEDDTLPGPGFFWFCEELLARYQDDLRVWHIGGFSTLNEEVLVNQDSYYFSKFNHIWGWASWANRWRCYDVKISLLDAFFKDRYIENITSSPLLQRFWIENFEAVSKGKIDTWDYQWYFTTWINGGLSIIPSVNLVKNIGFGAGATHTGKAGENLSRMEIQEIPTELVHPLIVMPNKVYDAFNAKVLFGLNYFRFFLRLIKRLIKNMGTKAS